MKQSKTDPKPPEQLELTAQMDITAGADSGDGKPSLPRFSMVAYTGAPMRLAAWRYPVVVDLAGLTIPSQSRPVRFGHDANSGVGHSDSIRVEDGRLVATGVVSRDTAVAKEIVASAKNGFPWQASIGASVEQFEFVKDNQAVLVNGRDFTGPLNVVRKATDFIVSAADLVLAGAVALPEPGDRIRVTVGDEVHVFEVMDLGGAGHWRPSDPYGHTLRIHTKLVDTEAAS